MNTSIITRAAGRAALKISKHSPTLLLGAGIVGSVATVVVACRATLQAQPVIEAHKKAMAGADEMLETRGNHGYDVEIHKKHVISIWTVTARDCVKLYAPAAVLGVASIACLTKSHQILSSRNVALTAAYSAVDKAYKAYRGRVVEELGEEKDTEFAHGPAEVGAYTEYDEKGNGKVRETKSAPKTATAVYGRHFDERNRFWAKDPGYNQTFLDNQMKWANIKLKAQGHMFLNDIYDLLGFERTREGAVVGWIYDTNEGDGYIDFGHHRYPDFVAGFERSVFLDFNVDGTIWDKI